MRCTSSVRQGPAKPHPITRKTEIIHCAHEDCGSEQFQVMNLTVSPIVTCVLCKQQTCAVSRVRWHKSMTCSENDEQQEALRWTPCPKCRTNIEKNLTSECMVDYRTNIHI